MRNMLVAATAGVAAAALSFAIVGCGSGTKTETKSSDSTSATAEIESLPTNAAELKETLRDELKKTLHDYIEENDIAETSFHEGDPGTPDFDFTLPPGWSDAGDLTPDWAYGAIIYDNPKDPNDPPTVIAIADKLTGDVQAAEILRYAPGLLDDLPEFKPLGAPTRSSFSGLDSIEYTGTYVHNGKTRIIDEQTIVAPAEDGFFVLQLNGDALEGEENVVLDAMKDINESTKVTIP